MVSADFWAARKGAKMDYDPEKFSEGYITEILDGKVKSGEFTREDADLIKRELLDWKEKKERSLFSLREKIKTGKRMNFFVISPLSHFESNSKFNYNSEMINAIMLLIWHRYSGHFDLGGSALLNNETKLHTLPEEWRNPLIYQLDQRSVGACDFIVGILSPPSGGLGQELERIAQNGVPVISILQRSGLSKKRFSYRTVDYDGTIHSHVLYKGRGGSSSMIIGNPSLHHTVTYPRDTVRTKVLQAVDNLGWRLQYMADGTPAYSIFKRLGNWLHPKLEKGNPRSIGLHNLDSALQEFGFVPETVKIDARISEIKSQPQNELTQREIAELRQKRKMLEHLLNFHPIHRNRKRMVYDGDFPIETRTYGERGGNGSKMVMGIYAIPKNGNGNGKKTSSH